MVSMKHGGKLSQMLGRGCGSGDMWCEGGTGTAECISGLFMGALGSGVPWRGTQGPLSDTVAAAAASGLLLGLYALMNIPLQNLDICDRILYSTEGAFSSLDSWKT